jgi:hypothetical protein
MMRIDADDIGLFTRLVAEDHRHIEVLAVGVGTFRTTDVGSSDDEVVEVQRLDVGKEDGRGVEVVDGDVEEALYLVGMKVHGDEAVDACHREQVGNELRTDGYTRLVFTVLTGPAEVGDDGGDALRGGALGSVDHQQKLHQIVGVGVGGLHQEHQRATDGLLIRDYKLAIGKMGDVHLSKWTIQTCADFFCEVLRTCAGEYHKGCCFAHNILLLDQCFYIMLQS